MSVKILFLAITNCLAFFALFPTTIFAQAPEAPKQEFLKAEVVSIENEGKKDIGGKQNIFQNIKLRIVDGAEKDKEVSLEYGGMFTITERQKLRTGESVILSKTQTHDNRSIYRVADRYRLHTILFLIIGFFLLIFVVAGKKGMGSVLGMLISLGVILWFIVPQILAGHDPLFISIAGSVFIMVTTMLLAHGFSRQTYIALASTCVSLFLTAVLAILFVNFAKLSGLGTEDAYSLQQMVNSSINFEGLLLGGIIIGSLGVLDDVTITQSSTIAELADSDEKATFQTLIKRGMKIGRDHIASVVNTLVLAYAGASIGIFIFLILGLQNNVQPLWVILNSEVITEEIIRTLAGTTGLILAVPITTLLAAFFAKYSVKIK